MYDKIETVNVDSNFKSQKRNSITQSKQCIVIHLLNGNIGDNETNSVNGTSFK